MRLLVAEDNETQAQFLLACLRNYGFECDWITLGADVAGYLSCQSYDALILDLGFPDMDGYQILKDLRSRGYSLPVLILTGRQMLEDKIRGLDGGADDFLVKPFEPEELRARIGALLRRPKTALGTVLELENMALDTVRRQVTVDGLAARLSRRELDLLEQLMRARGNAVPRERLLERLYSFSDRGSPGALDVLIHRLRRKLTAMGVKAVLSTSPGIGYMLASPAEETKAG